MPSRTPRSTAYGVERLDAPRAPAGARAARSPSGRPARRPARAPRAELARPRPRRRGCRRRARAGPRRPGAGKKPPRQRLDTLQARVPDALAAAPGTSLCRQGASQPMPASAQASTTCSRARWSAVIWLKESRAGSMLTGGPRPARADAACARTASAGSAQQAGGVGEPEELGEVHERARALGARRPCGSAPGGR